MPDKIFSVVDGSHDELPSVETAKAGRMLITTDKGEMYYEPEDKKRIQINPQADWQQDDNTAIDYIKNRRFINGESSHSLRTSGSKAETVAYKLGQYALAEGKDTMASSDIQHAQGKYNIEDTNNKYADIIGNGTSDSKRSNAHTVDWNGNGWYAGDVYVGSTSGTNKDEGSKKLATEIYTNTVSANAIKGSVSGLNIVQITDKNNNLCPVEHNMSVKVRSKNLIPYPFLYKTATNNGITFTDNKDGTITLNGQNNGSDHSTYNLFNAKDKLNFLKPNTDYCYYGNINNVNYSLGTVTSSGNNKYYTNSIINFPDGETPVRLIMQIKKGDTRIFNNTIVKLQLELGTTSTDYTPYIPDLTAIKVKKQGKNLIPFPYADTTTELNGITFTDNGDGTITVNGTATDYIRYTLTELNLYHKGTYVMSGCPTGGSTSTYFLSAQNRDNNYTLYKTDVGNGITIDLSNDDTLLFMIRIASGTTVENLTFKPQLELGTTATEYEMGVTPVEYTPNLDGTVNKVTSLYPTTTLISDTDGVYIDCEYNVDLNSTIGDINTALDSIIEIQNSLIGGN